MTTSEKNTKNLTLNLSFSLEPPPPAGFDFLSQKPAAQPIFAGCLSIFSTKTAPAFSFQPTAGSLPKPTQSSLSLLTARAHPTSPFPTHGQAGHYSSNNPSSPPKTETGHSSCSSTVSLQQSSSQRRRLQLLPPAVAASSSPSVPSTATAADQPRPVISSTRHQRPSSSSSLTDPICHPKQRRRRRSPNPQTGLQQAPQNNLIPPRPENGQSRSPSP